MARNILLLIICNYCYDTYAQIINVEAGHLISVIKLIENESDYHFNYDPDIINDIRIPQNMTINLVEKSTAIEALLSTTTIDFQIQDDLIILVPPKKERIRICGYLIDDATDESLQYAHIYWDARHGAWTDDHGYFDFEIETYKYDLINVSYLGYNDTALTVRKFQYDCQDIAIEKNPFMIQKEVIIRDYLLSSITDGESYNGKSIDMKHVNQELGAIEKDVLKTIQFLPGITSLDETASNLTIRGAGPDQNLILWEDAPMYNSGHFFGMISSINPFVIDQLDVYSDVYSAAYDNRVGGVIDIRLTDDIPISAHFATGTTMTESHLDLSLPVIDKQLGISVSGRGSLTYLIEDNITFNQYSEKIFQSNNRFDLEDDTQLESELYQRFYDINAKAIWSINPRMKFTTAYLTTMDAFMHEYEINEDTELVFDSLETRTNIFSNKLSYEWSKNNNTTLHINQSDYKSDYTFLFEQVNDASPEFLLNTENNISDTQIKLIHQYRQNLWTLNAGYIYDIKDIEYESEEVSFYENDISESNKERIKFHHLFADWQWYKNKWHVDIGNRWTYIPLSQNFYVSPRLSIGHSPLKNLKWQFSMGHFHQFVSQLQNFTESDLNIENPIWLADSENVMSSSKINFGVTYSLGSILFDIDTYYQHTTGVIVANPNISSIFDEELFGQSFSRGMTFLFKKRWNRLTTGLSYNFGVIDFRLDELDDDIFPANNDQRHNLNLITNYKWSNWHVSLQYSYRSALPFTEINGVRLDQELDESFYEIEINGVNELRLDPFHRLDITLGYKTSLLEKFNLDVQFSIFNITRANNILNINHFLINSDDTTDEPEIEEFVKRQLGITPQILFRISI